MFTGDGIRKARRRAGCSREDFAQPLRIPMRAVGIRERGDTFPSKAKIVLRSILLDYFDQSHAECMPLGSASDTELSGQIARRFAKSSEAQSHNGSAGRAEGNAPVFGGFGYGQENSRNTEPDAKLRSDQPATANERYRLAGEHGREGSSKGDTEESQP